MPLTSLNPPFRLTHSHVPETPPLLRKTSNFEKWAPWILRHLKILMIALRSFYEWTQYSLSEDHFQDRWALLIISMHLLSIVPLVMHGGVKHSICSKELIRPTCIPNGTKVPCSRIEFYCMRRLFIMSILRTQHTRMANLKPVEALCSMDHLILMISGRNVRGYWRIIKRN
jgi:hypothetical protein